MQIYVFEHVVCKTSVTLFQILCVNTTPPNVAYQVSIGSDYGLSPIQCQAIIQCWVIDNWILRDKSQWHFNQNTKLFTHENTFETIVCEMAAILSMGRWVNALQNLRIIIFVLPSLCVRTNTKNMQWHGVILPIRHAWLTCGYSTLLRLNTE